MNHLFIDDKIRISLTDACNCTCFYCHNEGQGHEKQKNYITLDFINNFVKFARENHITIKKISITGGEPTLHRDFLSIAKSLKSISKEVVLNTNGLLLNFEKIDEIKKLGINEIKFGIDNLFDKDSKANMYVQNSNNSKLIENVLYARKIGIDVMFNVVITSYNYRRCKEMLDFGIKNNVSSIKFVELINFDYYSKKGLTESHDYYLDFIESIKFNHLEYNPSLGRFFALYGIDDYHLKFANDYCKSKSCGSMYSVINAKGKLVICPKSGEALKLDFNDNLFELIKKANNDICDFKTNKFIRDINGIKNFNNKPIISKRLKNLIDKSILTEDRRR